MTDVMIRRPVFTKNFYLSKKSAFFSGFFVFLLPDIVELSTNNLELLLRR